MFALCVTAISALPLKCRLSDAANLYSSVKCSTGLGVCTQLTMLALPGLLQRGAWLWDSFSSSAEDAVQTLVCLLLRWHDSLYLLFWIFQIFVVTAEEFTDCEIKLLLHRNCGGGYHPTQHLSDYFLYCCAFQASSPSLLFLAPFHIVCSFLSKQHFDKKAASISGYMLSHNQGAHCW